MLTKEWHEVPNLGRNPHFQQSNQPKKRPANSTITTQIPPRGNSVSPTENSTSVRNPTKALSKNSSKPKVSHHLTNQIRDKKNYPVNRSLP
jgi:hypothetical protein